MDPEVLLGHASDMLLENLNVAISVGDEVVCRKILERRLERKNVATVRAAFRENQRDILIEGDG